MHQRTNLQPTAHHLEIITDQIGRPPKGIHSISATDANGIPLVLRMHAIVADQPFPTLYWLTSPALKKAISQIESQGVIKELEQRLQADQDLMQAYHDSHRDYVRQRWHYMSPAQQEQARKQGFETLLRERGIGGIANWDQVRCLHTQYAHHLCGHNIVGQWLDREYGLHEIL